MSQVSSPVEPSRKTTRASTFSDDAVPETDPSNVSDTFFWGRKEGEKKGGNKERKTTIGDQFREREREKSERKRFHHGSLLTDYIHALDRRPPSRKIASLETCSGVLGRVHGSGREIAQGPGQGI